jgi:hypothetical protein
VRLRLGWTPWLIPIEPPAPPACPEGWQTGPPDFVGVGAQKSGTSWWYSLVQAHPEVHRSQARKELHYFGRYWERPFTDADVAGYHALFPRPPGTITGEWTPNYLVNFWTLPLLHRAAPRAKILVLLRDPVDRYVSGLAHSLGRGLAPHHWLVATAAMVCGLYFEQLMRILNYFPRERVLVLQYERCLEDTLGELERTYRFLEIDPEFTPAKLDELVNSTKVEKPKLPQEVERALEMTYRDDVVRLAEAFPEIDLRLWPRFAHASAGTEARLTKVGV